MLGGGRGTRLDPLTRYRSKPAVPLGGKFRLVDIPVSNSLNSGVTRIFVITQFNSASLNAHIFRTFQFGPFQRGFVQSLAAEQTVQEKDWFQGTADAVRRSLVHIEGYRPRDVLILSGDQIYRMDFGPMIRQHRSTGAAVTVAATPVSEDRTSALGLMKLDPSGRILSFLEKPESPDLLAGHELPSGLREKGDTDPVYPASMGIYLFRFDVLRDVVTRVGNVDFGRDVLPRVVEEQDARGHIFRGYWEDIGTIRAYYEANLALAASEPPFVFHTPGAPVYTRPRFLGPTRITGCSVRESMICEGSYLHGSVIDRSVIGIRSVVSPDASLTRTVMFGADGYEGDLPRQQGDPPLGIGRGSHIEGALIDRNARIGEGVRITPKPAGMYEDHDFHFIRDGIVVIPKNYAVPDGAEI